MAKTFRPFVATALILTSVLAGALSGTTAGADPATMAVGPHQNFVGLVNGQSQNADVKVLCPGPVRAAQTGRPVTGQTLTVATSSASAAASGFTGGRADSIVAEFVPVSTIGAAIAETFTYYGSLPIPTSVLLPCNGTAAVLFAPRPTSHPARSTRVAITFVPICGSTTCPTGGRANRPRGRSAPTPGRRLPPWRKSRPPASRRRAVRVCGRPR